MDFSLLLMAVVPSAILLWLFLSSDKYPEPAAALVSSFVLGMLIVLGIYLLYPFLLLVASLLPGDNPYAVGLGQAFLVAAIPEECLKFIVLRRYCVNHPAFDEPMDGIVYGVTVSLGFATAENLLFVLDGGMTVAVGRAFLAVPCHALLGAVMGYHVGHAAFTRGERTNAYLKALALPILFHGLYDFTPLTIKAAERMDMTLPGPAGIALNALFCVSLFILVQYVMILTRSMKKLQRGERGPGFGFSRAIGTRVRPKYPELEGRRFGGLIKAYRTEAGPMDLLFSLLCVFGVICALAAASRTGHPGDSMSRISIVVAVIFFVYGIGFAARGMGKIATKMIKERNGTDKG